SVTRTRCASHRRRKTTPKSGTSTMNALAISSRYLMLKPRRIDMVGCSSGAQAIAEPVHGLDRVGTDGAELLADPADVAVDGALGDVVPVAPGAIDQLVARVHAAGGAHERAQQAKLGHRQHHRRLVPEALAALHVEREEAALQRRLRVGIGG